MEVFWHRVVTILGHVFGETMSGTGRAGVPRGERPGRGLTKTAERFIDPDTGKAVDVFYNPRTDERQHVADEPEKKAQGRT